VSSASKSVTGGLAAFGSYPFKYVTPELLGSSQGFNWYAEVPPLDCQWYENLP